MSSDATLRGGGGARSRKAAGSAGTSGERGDRHIRPLPIASDAAPAAGRARIDRRPGPALQVRVVHGHVKDVDRPIILGHQDGTPLAGPEKVANRRLGGLLARRIELGTYPGRLGTSEVFALVDQPSSTTIVIGLGNAGDITPVALTAAVTRGVLSVGATNVDPLEDELREIKLAAVLLGTNLVPPLPVESSLNAIVTGVRHANRRLRDTGDPLVVTDLEIVELYEERASVAVHALRRLARGTAQDEQRLKIHPRIVDGRDGLEGSPPAVDHEGTWRTIRIVNANPRLNPSPDDELVELSFTSVGRAARAEQRVNTGQRALVDELVSRVIHKADADNQVSNTLYELLVPNTFKTQGYGEENMMIIVDEQAAMLPLEMLAVRTPYAGLRPVAVDVGVLRRLETRTFETLTRQAAGNDALVIGDPPGTGQERLDGAREEARRVAKALTDGGYRVTSIIGDEGAEANGSARVTEIVNALFRCSYRIVHLAGHGAYSTNPARSGMLIGPNRFLTALEISKMTTAPTLVFLNCCHLAAMLPRRGPDDEPGRAPRPLRADRFAASISRQLIENGVPAVIAAGWAVDDSAAADFAERFYESMLGGDDYGAAIRQARLHVHDKYAKLNTWGAYQAYGPPALRLTRERTPIRLQPSGRGELRVALNEIQQRALAIGNGEPLAALHEDLRATLKDVPDEWMRGTELALLASVWEALAAYDEAVPLLEKLNNDWAAAASLENLEHLANLKAKWAVQLTVHNTDAGPGRQPDTLLDEAEKILQVILQLQRTPHRLSMLGSFERRRARCTTDPDSVTTALEAARDAYGEANRIHRARREEADFYSGTLEAVLDWLVAERKGVPRTELAAASATLEELHQERRRRSDDGFWNRVADADAALTLALVRGELESDADSVAERYLTAFARSSMHNRTVVLEHLDLIQHALPAGLIAVAAVISTLRTRLASWQSEASTVNSPRR